MFETLFAKTFAILGLQLALTWMVTVLVIRGVTVLYHAKVQGITASRTDDNELDLDISWKGIRPYFYTLLVADILVFLALYFFGRQDLSIGLPLFSLWSMLTGIELALALLSVDENMGSRVLAITVSVTVGCGIVGMYAGIDFGFLENVLLIGLLLLLSGNLIRLFIRLPATRHRMSAFWGVAVFTGYLVMDFNSLAKLENRWEANTWATAMDLSIELYLDIINLFLQLLEAMGDS